MRFSFESRCRLVSLVLAGQSPEAAAAARGASRASGYRLWRRYQDGGWAALVDRALVPRHQPRRLPRELGQRILAAREVAKAGPVGCAKSGSCGEAIFVDESAEPVSTLNDGRRWM
jgi:hypothetical protein